ncbi:hypothetical protein HYQ46_002576 [Verticillium longisporum]|nr:hypothetical protein HYQ46_002576 [Verticillium longisporum]
MPRPEATAPSRLSWILLLQYPDEPRGCRPSRPMAPIGEGACTVETGIPQGDVPPGGLILVALQQGLRSAESHPLPQSIPPASPHHPHSPIKPINVRSRQQHQFVIVPTEIADCC